MRYTFLLLALVLAGCTAAPQQPEPQARECPLFEIPSETGCCRDLNENGVCDTVDYAGEIAAEKQQEYEEAAEKARETAEQAGKLKPTIVNELYENASKTRNYRFLANGDEVVVANGSVVRKLVNERDLGVQDVNGRRQKIIVTHILLDGAEKKAMGVCVPKPVAQKLERSSPCDPIASMQFEVPYAQYAMTLPLEWLGFFLHRTPFEVLPGTEVGKRRTTLYRFTALNDADRRTSIWVDVQTTLPVKAEIRQGDELIRQDLYADFYPLN
jgi:hypothetical protein